MAVPQQVTYQNQSASSINTTTTPSQSAPVQVATSTGVSNNSITPGVTVPAIGTATTVPAAVGAASTAAVPAIAPANIIAAKVTAPIPTSAPARAPVAPKIVTAPGPAPIATAKLVAAPTIAPAPVAASTSLVPAPAPSVPAVARAVIANSVPVSVPKPSVAVAVAAPIPAPVATPAAATIVAPKPVLAAPAPAPVALTAPISTVARVTAPAPAPVALTAPISTVARVTAPAPTPLPAASKIQPVASQVRPQVQVRQQVQVQQAQVQVQGQLQPQIKVQAQTQPQPQQPRVQVQQQPQIKVQPQQQQQQQVAQPQQVQRVQHVQAQPQPQQVQRVQVQQVQTQRVQQVQAQPQRVQVQRVQQPQVQVQVQAQAQPAQVQQVQQPQVQQVQQPQIQPQVQAQQHQQIHAQATVSVPQHQVQQQQQQQQQQQARQAQAQAQARQVQAQQAQQQAQQQQQLQAQKLQQQQQQTQARTMTQQPQVPQVQHQQHLPPQGLNGGWQSESDIDARRRMIAKIVQLLQARKPNAPQDWLNKLPQMAKRLEETLYRTAPTFIAYNDANTLKQRLQQLAMRMKQPKNNRQAQQQLFQRQQQELARQQAQAAAQQAQQVAQRKQPAQAQQAAAPSTHRMVNMSEINPTMSSQTINPQHAQTNAPVAGQVMPQVTPTYQTQTSTVSQTVQAQQAQGAMNGNVNIGAKHPPSQPVSAANGLAAAPAPMAQSKVTNNNTQQTVQQQRPAQQTSAGGTGGPSRSTSDRAQVLRHQQQRLLLLRHAAKCPHEDGQCPVTPHCAGMKRLWKHIAECKNQKCQVPHCVSSRYVLSHYHRCKDVRCPVCGPVREAIHRSHEKQKQMSELKKNFQKEKPGQGQVPAAVVSSQPIPPPQQKSAPIPTAVQSQQQRRTNPPAKLEEEPPVKKQRVQPPGPVVSQQRPPGSGPRQRWIYSGGKPNQNPSGGVKPTKPLPVEDLTLINSFTIGQIERHIQSLNRGIQLPVAKLKVICGDVLKNLQQHSHGWVFNSPVDPVELGLPDYFEVVKRPMDLGTIKKRMENGCYHSLEAFHVDVNLTFENAMLYNPEGSVVYNMAKEMKDKFALDYTALITKLKAEEDEKRKKGDACALCGMEKLLFEPPVFYCNGLKCSSQRIRRNSYYYVGGNNKYHWCHQCYGDLKDNQELQMPDATFRKQDLLKKKNDEVREESWVHCDRCNRWIHQICGLFNTRKNQDQRSEYVCPRCTMNERKKKGQIKGTSKTPMAADLQRTKLSEFLENHIHGKVEKYIENMIKEKAERENITVEEAHKDFESGGPITIRQVTSTDRKLEVREHMKKRYAFKNYPDEFNYRCKCIIVFQNLDGVDVILFGLYVYEHDERTPAPNQRSVYLSYLDSVHYMRPRKMRTYIYHEILVSYLEYVRLRGFSTVHIWACPPGKGDDYILYAKPEDQKTPRDDRLKTWYYNMLIKAQQRGIVGKVTNMYDLYFADSKHDATMVPYMEGDYFPGEVENCIRDMEDGKHSKKAKSDGKKKKKAKSKNKNKSGRKGTRSGGIDEEALAASGILPPGYDQKSMEQGNPDYVMTKLGQIIEGMKESFIVAHLTWDGAKKENLIVPKEILEARKKLAVAKSAVKNENGEKSGNDVKMEDASEKENAKNSGPVPMDTTSDGNGGKPDQSKPAVSNGKVVPKPNKELRSANVKKEANFDASEEVRKKIATVQREGKFAAMEARKRTIEQKEMKDNPEKDNGKIKPKAAMTTVKDRYGKLVKVLDDDLEEMDCEFLNNRQLFLELCQTNNYQFDQHRRAKHSSMMVLWHLHNRDAPKFVQQCAQCAREILTGYRYHCPTCADFDLCHDCYQKPIQRHPHQLKPIPVTENKKNDQTEEQRRERQRSIQLHMTLLLHAATCISPKCHSQNCAKMKGLLVHGDKCQTKAAGGCNVCKRIWTLLQIHARQCKEAKCPVPKCLAIRERFRQIAAQQRAMDDRRRQHFNTRPTG